MTLVDASEYSSSDKRPRKPWDTKVVGILYFGLASLFIYTAVLTLSGAGYYVQPEHRRQVRWRCVVRNSRKANSHLKCNKNDSKVKQVHNYYIISLLWYA